VAMPSSPYDPPTQVPAASKEDPILGLDDEREVS